MLSIWKSNLCIFLFQIIILYYVIIISDILAHLVHGQIS